MPDTSPWKPVDESASAWKPVAETPKPAPADTSIGGMAKTAGRGLLRVAMAPGESLVNGARELATPGQRIRGAGHMIEGVGKAALGLAVPEMLANPGSAVLGGLAGAGVSKLAGGAARMAGADPDTERLVGDVAPMVAGPFASRAVGAGARALAKPFVRTAMKLPPIAHENGAEPEQFALDYTKSFKPGKIEAEAQQVMDQKSQERNAALVRAGQRGVTAPLAPVRQLTDSAIRGEEAKNLHPRLIRPLQDIEEHLTMAHPGFGGPTVGGVLAPDQPPIHFQNIKQGLQNFTHFDPTKSTDASVSTANRAYHQMGEDLERAVPGTAKLNHVIQSAIPLANRAHAMDLNAGPLENAVDAATKPTGSLVAPALGVASGHPLAGATIFAIQQALKNPAVNMGAARGLYGAGKALPSLTGQRASQLIPLASQDQSDDQSPGDPSIPDPTRRFLPSVNVFPSLRLRRTD